MRPDVGFFDLAFQIVDSIEADHVVVDDAPDKPGKDKKASIVVECGLPDEDEGIQNVTNLVNTAFLNAIPEEKCKDFDCAATRYQGLGCFYFTWSGSSKIDFNAVRKQLEFCRDMFREAPYRSPGNIIFIGPFSSAEEQIFPGLLQQVIDYLPEDISEMEYKLAENAAGKYFAFPRDKYLQLFRHEKNFNPELKIEGEDLEPKPN